MAHLLRVTRQNDTFNSQTFTFLLPHAACRGDDAIEIASRDFQYCGHKFYLSFTKDDQKLLMENEIAFLTPNLFIKSLHNNQCATVTVDVTFVLVNRMSFSSNQIFHKKQVEFRVEDQTNSGQYPMYSRKEFIPLVDMTKRGFTDNRGEFLFELTLKACSTTFQYDMQLTHDPTKSRDPLDYQRYDGAVFTFGDLKWSWVFCPNMDLNRNNLMRHMLQMVRKTRFDTLCKLVYRVLLVDKPGNRISNQAIFHRKHLCDQRSEIFDFSGNGDGVYFTDNYLSYVSQDMKITFAIEIFDIFHLNHVRLNVLSSEKQPVAQIFDKENRSYNMKFRLNSRLQKYSYHLLLATWRLSLNYPIVNEGDESEDKKLDDQFLYVKFAYVDSSNVPRNYGRYVAWNMQIISQTNTSQDDLCSENTTTRDQKSVVVGDPIVERYFSIVGRFFEDKFYTSIKLKELKKEENCWLHKLDRRLLIQIEWLSSHLFYEPCYCTYDDVYRKQVMQMRHVLQTLQSQNDQMERELYFSQVSKGERAIDLSGNPIQRRLSMCTAANAKDSGKEQVLQSLVSSTVLAASSVAMVDGEDEKIAKHQVTSGAVVGEQQESLDRFQDKLQRPNLRATQLPPTPSKNIRQADDNQANATSQSQKLRNIHQAYQQLPQSSSAVALKPYRKMTPEILISPENNGKDRFRIIENEKERDDSSKRNSNAIIAKTSVLCENRRKMTEPSLIVPISCGPESKYRSRSYANFSGNSRCEAHSLGIADNFVGQQPHRKNSWATGNRPHRYDDDDQAIFDLHSEDDESSDLDDCRAPPPAPSLSSATEIAAGGGRSYVMVNKNVRGYCNTAATNRR
uniref:Uncharacterized protein n=1 Tax=Romanomermis culicivorax TaxID=13658 RepID=A0A915I9J7_ROMCU